MRNIKYISYIDHMLSNIPLDGLGVLISSDAIIGDGLTSISNVVIE